MRINDHQLLQTAGPDYVVLDETNGTEIVFTPQALARLEGGIRYFAIDDPDLRTERTDINRCRNVLVHQGTHHPCDVIAPHPNLPHASTAADAIWGDMR